MKILFKKKNNSLPDQFTLYHLDPPKFTTIDNAIELFEMNYQRYFKNALKVL